MTTEPAVVLSLEAAREGEPIEKVKKAGAAAAVAATATTPRMAVVTALVGFLVSETPVRWSRVLASAIVIGVGVVSGIAWTQRDEIGQALGRRIVAGGHLRFNEKAAPAVVQRLVADTGAQVGTANVLHLERYSRRMVYAVNADKQRLLENVDEVPIAVGYTDLLGKMMMGEIPCYDIDGRAAADTRYLQQRESVKHFCVTGVPPGYGVGLVGTVGVWFKDKPPTAEMGKIQGAMRAAARALAQ